ncbi:MAG: radical SAM protein [Polyangiaceae bacterium]
MSNSSEVATLLSLVCRAVAPTSDWRLAQMALRPALFEARLIGPAVVRLRVSPRSPSLTPALRFERCELRYSLDATDLSSEQKQQIGEALRHVGETFDLWLSTEGARQRFLSAQPEPTLSIDRVREACEELLLVGSLVGCGWVLGDLVDASTFWSTQSVKGFVVDFVRNDGAERYLVCVEQRRDEIYVRPSGRSTSEERWLLELVAFVAMLCGARARVAEASPSTVVANRSKSAPTTAVAVSPSNYSESANVEVKLILNSDCQQRCRFCSILETMDSSSQSQSLEEIFALIDEGVSRGAKSLRLSGLDPLTHSSVIEIVRYASERGISHVDVQSPSTKLSDLSLLDRLLEAANGSCHFHVPYYGVTDETHDRVVGVPGAHQLVERALSNILLRCGPTKITLSLVITPDTLPEAGEVIRYARAKRLVFVVRMPFPDSESRADKFFSLTRSMTEVVDTLFDQMGIDAFESVYPSIEGVAPCVVLSRAQPRVPPSRLSQWVDQLRKTSPMRRLGARTPFVRCSHADRCELATTCGGELLRAYVMAHGTTELVPILEGRLRDELRC